MSRPQCRAILGRTSVEHRADLWPNGEPAATPEWIAGNVPGILDAVARLFAEAGDNDYQPRAVGFLTRMAWLPAMIRDLDA